MYVPGQLSDVSTVLVDVGTGYYVEMVRKRSNCERQEDQTEPLFTSLQQPRAMSVDSEIVL